MVENNVESVRENDRYLETIINRKKRTIPIASIEYVESRGRKIVLHLGCGEMTFYSKISEIEEKLVNNGFVRVHQSFMVQKLWLQNQKKEYTVCKKDMPAFYSKIRQGSWEGPVL